MSEQEKTEQPKERKPLSTKIGMPSNRIMTLMPILGIASLLALVGAMILGITLLRMLANRAQVVPPEVVQCSKRVEILVEKVEEIERAQKDLRRKINDVTALANKLYFERPLTESAKMRVELAKLRPSELLERGIAAQNTPAGKPAAHFEVLLETYPDSQEAPAAMLHLGALRTRLGDYEEALVPLKRYLDHFESLSAYDTARVNFYMGIAMTSLDRKKEAAAHFQEALTGLPEDDILRANARFNLGEIYRRLGQRDKAAAEYGAVLEEFADNKSVRNMLELTKQRLESLDKDK